MFALMIALCMAGDPSCTERQAPEPMTLQECNALVDPVIETLAAEVLVAKFDREVTIYVACVDYTYPI